MDRSIVGRGNYDFSLADRYVDFAEQQGLHVVGHTLVWHTQAPDRIFEDGEGGPVDREQLIGRMREHITTVVGRYRGGSTRGMW